MKRSRNQTLERDIVRALKWDTRLLKSVDLARIVGANIETTRLALMDLSTDGVTHRSKKGYYRLVRDIEL